MDEQPTCETAATNELQTMRDIRIRQVTYGYIVDIGCACFAIETQEKMIEKVAEYIKNPRETENKFHKEKSI